MSGEKFRDKSIQLIRSSFGQVEIQKETEDTLLPLSVIAKNWIDDRETMGSIRRSVSEGKVDLDVFSGVSLLVDDFRRVYSLYVQGAVEESLELKKAKSNKEKAEEIGDVMFYLLHFFNAADLDVGQVISLSQDSSMWGEKEGIGLRVLLLRSISKTNLVVNTVKQFRDEVRFRNIEAIPHPMAFGDQRIDAPWLDYRNTEHWMKFKNRISKFWLVAFEAVLVYGKENKIDMLETVKNTAEKATQHFPKEFFSKKYSLFSSLPEGEKYDIDCCRLFRNRFTLNGLSYIDMFHSLIQEFGGELPVQVYRSYILLCLSILSDNDDWTARGLLNVIDKIGSDRFN
ncbi:MAG: hypothetical protein ABIJ43_05225 [Candidatus Beckwithbacteria bacterium]